MNDLSLKYYINAMPNFHQPPKTSSNKLKAYITSASKGSSEGASPRYCHAAWHQHLNAGKGDFLNLFKFSEMFKEKYW